MGEIMKPNAIRSGIAAATLLACPAVHADSGTYESVVSLVYQYKSMEHADGTVTGGGSAGTSTIVKSSGPLFAEGGSSAFECVVFARKSAAGMDLEAPCTSTDASGEKVFSVAKRRVGEVSEGGGGQGSSTIVGGTGRYAGITGSCTYRVDFLSANRLVSTSKCRWQRP
jgi:hypothetical protein